jgi:hypothetical protein
LYFAITKEVFNKEKTFATRKFDLNLSKKLVKCYSWSITFYNAVIWTLRKVDQKYWNILKYDVGEDHWTDYVRNEEVFIWSK